VLNILLPVINNLEGLFDNYLKTNRLRNVVLDKVQLDFSLFEHEACELTLIDLIIGSGKLKLLDHPLVVAFINLKWLAMWKLYMFFMALFFCDMVALTGCILTEHGSPIIGANTEQIRYGWWISFLVLNSIIGAVICLKTFEAISTRIMYKGEIEGKYSIRNYEEMMARLSLVKEAAMPLLGFAYLFTNYKEIACLLILGSAYHFMINMSRIPSFGTHVFITGKVFSTIAEFFLSYLVVIFGYATIFHILLRKEDNAFGNLGDSLIKTLTMLLGEFEFFSYLEHPENNGLTVRFVFLSFLLCMSIVVMNLVIGLAIGDIETMRKNANIHKLVSSIMAIRLIDELSNFFNIFSKTSIKSKKVSKMQYGTVYIDLREKHFCARNNFIIEDPLDGSVKKETCPKKIIAMVEKIVQKRWSEGHEEENDVK